MNTLRPAALKSGDRVGLVCPGGRPDSPRSVEFSQAVVREMGFHPVVGENVLNVHGYMAGTDEERLSDINRFLCDDSVSGIFCITGGFGAMHLLPGLDYEAILRRPKVFVGSDDNTVLLLGMQVMTGLVTFHGPNLTSAGSRFNFDRLKRAVTSPSPLEPVTVGDNRDCEVVPAIPFTPVAGAGEGRLLGGNLTALVSLMGTPYQPEFQDSVLFLDDIDERNDILDRWLTNLYVSGALQRIRGCAMGGFKNCGPKGMVNSLSLMELFSDRFKEISVPCFFDLPLGSGGRAVTLPLGVRAILDAEAGRLEFLEAGLA